MGYGKGMEIVVLIVIFGLIFDYTNGFHDAANVVSTVIATRVLAPLSAIVMAGVLNFIGATQISGVAQTIATGLVDAREATQVVVLAAVLGAIFWNLITWYYGIPSSSSYALIGGLLGSSWVHEGFDTILCGGVIGKVLIPMVLSTMLGHAEYSPNYQQLLEHGDATDVGDCLAAGDEAAIRARVAS